MVQDPSNKAAPRTSMRIQLKSFIASCRCIARHTMEQGDAELLRCNKAKKPRLLSLGIRNHVPTVNFQLVIDSKVATEITQAILKSQANRSSKTVADLLAHRKKTQMHNMSTVNRTKWSRSIKTNDKICAQRAGDEKERKRRIQERADIEKEVLPKKTGMKIHKPRIKKQSCPSPKHL